MVYRREICPIPKMLGTILPQIWHLCLLYITLYMTTFLDFHFWYSKTCRKHICSHQTFLFLLLLNITPAASIYFYESFNQLAMCYTFAKTLLLVRKLFKMRNTLVQNIECKRYTHYQVTVGVGQTRLHQWLLHRYLLMQL